VTRHAVLLYAGSQPVRGLAFCASARLQARLSVLDPIVYPLPACMPCLPLHDVLEMASAAVAQAVPASPLHAPALLPASAHLPNLQQNQDPPRGEVRPKRDKNAPAVSQAPNPVRYQLSCACLCTPLASV
jgi:hypothetical protein